MSNEAATSLNPFDVDLVRNIAGDPYHENYNNADGEREAQEIVRVFRPLRKRRERFGAHQRQQQARPKVMLRPVKAMTTKQLAVIQCAKRSKAGEAYDLIAGAAPFDTHWYRAQNKMSFQKSV